MRRILFVLLPTLLLPTFPLGAPARSSEPECVVLLHGLARTARSMERMQEALEAAGYHVVNIDYPSREAPVAELAERAVGAGLEGCAQAGRSPVHFVTHSLGGILVREYYHERDPGAVGRVVMLGPPNRGSQVVDELRDVPGFELIHGPAGAELGTDDESTPSRLGPVRFELGVIAGTRSINWILSSFLPDPDDGKVSVDHTRVEGMCGFVALPVTHPLMMRDDDVIEQTVHFLQHGRFSAEGAETHDCGGRSPDA